MKYYITNQNKQIATGWLPGPPTRALFDIFGAGFPTHQFDVEVKNMLLADNPDYIAYPASDSKGEHCEV